jgi:hypothetical protein
VSSQAAELGLELMLAKERLEQQLGEVLAECDRLRSIVDETSHELAVARTSRLQLMNEVDALNRDNYRCVVRVWGQQPLCTPHGVLSHNGLWQRSYCVGRDVVPSACAALVPL